MTDKSVIRRVQTMRATLDKMAPEFRKVLCATISPERFVRVALTACQRTSGLLDCTQESFLGALMEAATLGLEPDGQNATLIPFRPAKSEAPIATFVPMYRGLLRLAHNSPHVAAIECEVVRERDHFEFLRGSERRIVHRPHWPTSEAGDLKAAYAIADMVAGGQEMVVMDRDQVLAIKAKSHGAKKDDSPWNDPTFEPAMWRKTALKQLCKLIPGDSLLARAIDLDDRAETGREQHLPPVEIPHTEAATATDEMVNAWATAIVEAGDDDKAGHILNEAEAYGLTAPQHKTLQAAWKQRIGK